MYSCLPNTDVYYLVGSRDLVDQPGLIYMRFYLVITAGLSFALSLSALQWKSI